jgi:hypothetical protein
MFVQDTFRYLQQDFHHAVQSGPTPLSSYTVEPPTIQLILRMRARHIDDAQPLLSGITLLAKSIAHSLVRHRPR